jgi:hypothetical protein
MEFLIIEFKVARTQSTYQRNRMFMGSETHLTPVLPTMPTAMPAERPTKPQDKPDDRCA